MNNDLNHVVAAKTNFEYFCNIEVVVRLMCIMPMLEAIHAVIKFVQAHNTFVCDFVIVVNCVVQNYTSCIFI
jgi:tryptophan synthase beta subunit